MARYKVVVAYDGSKYKGWQRQLNTNTIQAEIESALYMIMQSEVTICASGRTDALVHAVHQVFHFDSLKQIDITNFVYTLNAVLPKDIRMKSIQEVSDDFHARFDATKKRYDYLISEDMENPFIENYMYKSRQVLDHEYMQECTNVFLGKHDFTSFSSHKIDPRKSKIKIIYRIAIIRHEKNIQIIFEGDGFLRYMVRMLAQTLIEAGRHTLNKNQIQAMLKQKDKHACHLKAKPQGLYLMDVCYDKSTEKGE